MGRGGRADPAVDRWPPGAHPPHAGRFHADQTGGAPGGPDALGRGPHVGLRALRHPDLPRGCAGDEGPRLSPADAARRRAHRADRDGRADGRWGSGSCDAWSTSRSESRGDRSHERGIYRPAGGHHADGHRPGRCRRRGLALAQDPEPARLHPLPRLGGRGLRGSRSGRRAGADAAGQPDLRPGGGRPAPQPVAALPVERHRPGPRRPAQGRSHRIGACRGVRRRAGGLGHARHRHRPRLAW